MSNLKNANLAIVAITAGVVILLSAETTKAGSFSVRVGGIGFGSWNTRCVERSYIYVNDYDDDDYYYSRSSYRECYRPTYRVYYRPQYREYYRPHHREYYRPHHREYRPYRSTYYRGHGGGHHRRW